MRIILIAMKKYLLLVSLFLLGATATFAETTFVFKKVSSKFDVKISVENCDDDICDGKATVYLMKKNQLKPFQTIQLEETHLQLRDGMKPNSGVNEVLDSSVYGVYFEDYNFDGAEDLALAAGTLAAGSRGAFGFSDFSFSGIELKVFRCSGRRGHPLPAHRCG